MGRPEGAGGPSPLKRCPRREARAASSNSPGQDEDNPPCEKPKEVQGEVKYTETIDRSAELLRLAIPLMSRQAAALHPVSYAVWYEYVAHTNKPLKEAVDEALRLHGRLDEAKTYAIHRQHVADVNPETAERVASGFDRILSDMAASATRVGDQTLQYARALDVLRDGLSEEVSEAVEEILDHTTAMTQVVQVLQRQLEESHREIMDLRSEVHRAQRESLVDALTGLANRRAFDQRLATCLLDESGRAASGPQACLIVADIDHFKSINDRYGHGFGDQVLQALAQMMKALVPETALAARIGGEEFAILLPKTNVLQAEELAEQIRSTISMSRIRRGRDETLQSVTVSLGVASARPAETPDGLLARADTALYASKQAGRNRVTAVRASVN